MDLLKMLLLPLGLIFLAGCGGGSGDSANTTYSSQALLGPVVGATVEVYDATDLSAGVLCTTVTGQSDQIDLAGMISIPSDCVRDEGLFLLVVSGGSDIDADDDGLLDDTPTPVNGRFHSLLTGAQLISGEAKATALTEAAYQHVRYLLASGSSHGAILQSLDNSALHLLKQDLNSDGQINHLDLAIWHPRLNRDSFRPSLERLNLLIRDIHQNNSTAQHAIALFDATAPILSELTSIGDADQVLLNGQRLYVAGGNGLIEVDVADPDNLQVVRTIIDQGMSEVSGITLTDNWLYLRHASYFEDDSVNLYDISLSSPGAEGSVIGDIYHPDGFDLNAFMMQDDYGYAALHRVNNPDDIENISHEFRLDILDLSSPAQPRLISSFEIDSFGSTMSVQGNRLYLGTGVSPYLYSGSLSVIDISNPAGPVLLSRLELNGIEALTVEGNRGYAITQTDLSGDSRDRITLLDLSNDNEIVVTGTFDTINNARSKRDLVVENNTGYHATSEGITVFDFSDSSNPVQVDRILTSNAATSLAVSEAVIYAAVDNYGVQVFDLTTRGGTDSPAIIGRIDLPSVKEIIPSGDHRAYLLAGDDLSRRVVGLDLSDPLNVGVTDSEFSDLYQNPTIVDQILFATSPFSGVSLFDISNPFSITQHSIYDTSVVTYAFAIAVSQNRALVGGALSENMGDIEQSLSLLDVEMPSDPVLLTRLSTEYQPNHIAIQDNVAYVIASDNRLLTYRISSANELTALGSLDIPPGFTPMEIIPQGNYAFLSQQHGLITVLDISDPARPSEVSSVDADGLVADIHLAGKLLYIAGQAGNLQVLNVERPETPEFVGYYRTPSSAQAVMVQNGHVYVAIQEMILISDIPADRVP